MRYYVEFDSRDFEFWAGTKPAHSTELGDRSW